MNKFSKILFGLTSALFILQAVLNSINPTPEGNKALLYWYGFIVLLLIPRMLQLLKKEFSWAYLSRLAAIAALLLLGFAVALLTAHNQPLAEQMTIYLFYALLIMVVAEILKGFSSQKQSNE